MKYPYTLSDKSISVYVDGRMYAVPSTSPGYKELKQHLKEADHDGEFIARCADPASYITDTTAGLVTVRGSEVYHKGEAIDNTVTKKLLGLMEEGLDILPWANFLDKLMQNPSFRSREQLYRFIEKWDMPLMPNGDFIAFKKVRADFFDIHSGTFDNSPGKTVSMDRGKVNDDPNVHCSNGLHVCSPEYLPKFGGSNSKTVSVAVSPADVVSVPSDYSFSKMRTCKYRVLEEVDQKQIAEYELQRVSPEVLVSGRLTKEDATHILPSNGWKIGDVIVRTEDYSAYPSEEYVVVEAPTYVMEDRYSVVPKKDYDNGLKGGSKTGFNLVGYRK